MSEEAHLSPLSLDEAVAGHALSADLQAHLDGCADCQAALAHLKQSAADLLASAPAGRTLDALLDRQPSNVVPFARRRAVLAAAVALPIAASLLFFVLSPSDSDERLKGGQTVELLDRDSHVVTKAHVGTSLELAVGGAGARWAAVFAVDSQGHATELFHGRLKGGARERLSRLEVTPGNVSVIALFANSEAKLLTVEQLEHAVSFSNPLPDSARVDLEVD